LTIRVGQTSLTPMPPHQIHKPGIWLGDDAGLDVDALFLGVLSSGGGLGGPADEGE